MSITISMRGEFDFIQHIKKKYDLQYVGDDCAVLPKDTETDLLVTADLLVEDIDFRLEWTTPELLGQKALAVSLSDIAAMGGAPEFALLSIGVPERVWKTDFVDRFYEGWHKLAQKFLVTLVGGDVSRTPDKVLIDSVVVGDTPTGAAVLRSGAKAGDAIFLSGPIGGAAAGLRLLESGVRYKMANPRERELITRQLRPVPRIDTGLFLRENAIASAMIDVSDGFAADLHHVCVASGTGAQVEAKSIPFDSNIEEASFNEMTAIWQTGEDFELLFTVPPEKISLLKKNQFICIGTIMAENAGTVGVILDNKPMILPPSGYVHF